MQQSTPRKVSERKTKPIDKKLSSYNAAALKMSPMSQSQQASSVITEQANRSSQGYNSRERRRRQPREGPKLAFATEIKTPRNDLTQNNNSPTLLLSEQDKGAGDQNSPTYHPSTSQPVDGRLGNYQVKDSKEFIIQRSNLNESTLSKRSATSAMKEAQRREYVAPAQNQLIIDSRYGGSGQKFREHKQQPRIKKRSTNMSEPFSMGSRDRDVGTMIARSPQLALNTIQIPDNQDDGEQVGNDSSQNYTALSPKVHLQSRSFRVTSHPKKNQGSPAGTPYAKRGKPPKRNLHDHEHSPAEANVEENQRENPMRQTISYFNENIDTVTPANEQNAKGNKMDGERSKHNQPDAATGHWHYSTKNATKRVKESRGPRSKVASNQEEQATSPCALGKTMTITSSSFNKTKQAKITDKFPKQHDTHADISDTKEISMMNKTDRIRESKIANDSKEPKNQSKPSNLSKLQTNRKTNNLTLTAQNSSLEGINTSLGTSTQGTEDAAPRRNKERHGIAHHDAQVAAKMNNQTQVNWSATSVHEQLAHRRATKNQTTLQSKFDKQPQFQKHKNLQQDLMNNIRSFDARQNQKIQVIDAAQVNRSVQIDNIASAEDIVNTSLPSLEDSLDQNLQHKLKQCSLNFAAAGSDNRRYGLPTGKTSEELLQHSLMDVSLSQFAKDRSTVLTPGKFMLNDQSTDQHTYDRDASSPLVRVHSIEQKANPKYQIQFDHDKVEGKEKTSYLPNIIKKMPQTTKNVDVKKEFRLPRDVKFTSDQKFSDLCKIRGDLRNNQIYHDEQRYQPFYGTVDGAYYFANVYQMNKHQDEVCDIDPKNPKYKDKLLGYTTPVNSKDPGPHEIADAKPKKEAKKAPQQSQSPKNVDDIDEKDLEKDFFTFLLKYHQLQPPASGFRVYGGGGERRKPPTEQKTAEQIEWEIKFRQVVKGLGITAIFRDFHANCKPRDPSKAEGAGPAFPIPLTNFAEIERKMKESDSLAKYKPINYTGSLRNYIQEIYEKMDNGFEVNQEVIRKINADELIIPNDSVFESPELRKFDRRILGNNIPPFMSKAQKKEFQMSAGLRFNKDKQLKMFSPIEEQHLVDRVKQKEELRLKQLSSSLQLKKRASKAGLEDEAQAGADGGGAGPLPDTADGQHSPRKPDRTSASHIHFLKEEKKLEYAERTKTFEAIFRRQAMGQQQSGAHKGKLDREESHLSSSALRRIARDMAEYSQALQIKAHKEKVKQRRAQMQSQSPRQPPASPFRLRAAKTELRPIKEDESYGKKGSNIDTGASREEKAFSQAKEPPESPQRAGYGRGADQASQVGSGSKALLSPNSYFRINPTLAPPAEPTRTEGSAAGSQARLKGLRIVLGDDQIEKEKDIYSPELARATNLFDLNLGDAIGGQLTPGLQFDSLYPPRESTRSNAGQSAKDSKSPRLRLKDSPDHARSDSIFDNYVLRMRPAEDQETPESPGVGPSMLTSRQAAPPTVTVPGGPRGTKLRAGETKTAVLRQEAIKQQLHQIRSKDNSRLPKFKPKESETLDRHMKFSNMNIARESLLRNSLTYDRQAALFNSSNTKALKKDMAKAIAISNLTSGSPAVSPSGRQSGSSIRRGSSGDNINERHSILNISRSVDKDQKGHPHGKRAFDLVLGLGQRRQTSADKQQNDKIDLDFINAYLTPKFQLSKEYESIFSAKYKRDSGDRGISVDITQSRMINQIKNAMKSQMNEWKAYRDSAGRGGHGDGKSKCNADFRLHDDQLAGATEKWDEFYGALDKACQYGVVADRATRRQRREALNGEFSKSSRSSVSSTSQQKAMVADDAEDLQAPQRAKSKLQQEPVSSPLAALLQARGWPESPASGGRRHGQQYAASPRTKGTDEGKDYEDGSTEHHTQDSSQYYREKAAKKGKKARTHANSLFQELGGANKVRLNCAGFDKLNPEPVRKLKSRMSKVGGKISTNLEAIRRMRTERAEDEEAEEDAERTQRERSSQNKMNLTVLLKSLERQFLQRDYLQNTEADREKILTEVAVAGLAWSQAIDNFRYENDQAKPSSFVKSDDLTVYPKIQEIMAEDFERDKFDKDNFLSKEAIARFTKINDENKQKMIQIEKDSDQKTKIWQPDKFVLKYSEKFKEIFDTSNTGGAK